MPDAIRRVVRLTLVVAGFLPIAAAVLYAIFWLPYQDPAAVHPYPLPILPDLPVHESPVRESSVEEYAWVDRDERIVRIPVEAAMRIAAERLPVLPRRDEKK